MFLSHACMKCPLQRRQHERHSCSENLNVKMGWFEQWCPDLSKVLNSTRFARTCGIFTHHRPHPRGQKRYMYHPACLPAGSWAEIARRHSLLIVRSAGAGSRGHNKTNTLRQQQEHLADILVQVPPNNSTT